jgi:hypothetical protein
MMRRNADAGTAQLVWTELLEFAKTSTAASFSIEDLETNIQTRKLDTTWRGTSVGFLHMFTRTLTELSDLCSSDEQWNDAVKKRYLMTAVRDNSDLQQVFEMDELNRINSPDKKGMSYQQFYNVLMSAATHYDHRHAAKINRGSYRKINYTNLLKRKSVT